MSYINKYVKYMKKCKEFNAYKYKLSGGKNLNHKQYGNDDTNVKINTENMENKDEYNEYEYNVSEPWFTLILLGLKTVEGRKNKGRFKEMKIGDTIKWTNNDFKPRSVVTKITKKTYYSTFKEYLISEGLDKCLPGIPDMDTGLSVYFKYFTKEDEREFGVIAIGLELIKKINE